MIDCDCSICIINKSEKKNNNANVFCPDFVGTDHIIGMLSSPNTSVITYLY